MRKNNKLIRITTVPVSLKTLLKGQHHFMSEHGFEVVGVSSPGKELQEVARDEGIRVVPIEMSRKITPFQDIKSLWKVIRLLRKEKPDIVHTHTPKAGIVGMLAARIAGVPLRLHTVAGLPLMEAKGLKRKILDFVEKLTYACATNVYPNSKGLYDFILKNKYTSLDKLRIIANGSSNGIDTKFFSKENVDEQKQITLKRELNIKNSDFVFIFVGRLVGDKGINELASAFSLVSQECLNTKLILVGAEERELDPLKPKTIGIIESNRNIVCVGFQEDVRPYFAIADALVFPSYREGFPNVVMQAGAMELPSIVTDINGCNEIIIENENGVIIPPKSVGKIVQVMKKIMQDNIFYNELKKNSRVMVRQKYEQIVVWNELLQEYQRLLSEKGK